MLFDLRDAPKVTGPKTQKALELIIGAWEAAARPIAIVVSPASMQRLQLSRIAKDVAANHSEVFLELDQARLWIEQRLLLAREAKGRSVRAAPGKRRG
jgi:hypothetical protein